MKINSFKKGLIKKTKTKKNKNNKLCSQMIPSYDKDIKATINLEAIANNINFLKKSAGTDIMPVLKADAYGHGLVNIAKYLRKINVKYIGVATLGEAILLRNSGDKGRILAWLYDIDGQELKDAFKLDIDIAIFDEKQIPKFIELAPKNKTTLVTAFVDTGINRASIPYDKALQACRDINACSHLKLEGIMSHLVCSQIKNSPIVNEQLRKFRKLRDDLKNENINPPLVHIANTGACLNYDVSDFTLSRSGSGTYGLEDKPNKNLTPAMTVTSYIIQTKQIDKGTGLGYDWTYKAPKKMWVSIVPIGYADILPRSGSNKMYVNINGTKRRSLGLISMDQMIVEGSPNDKISDIVTFFGDKPNNTIYELAKKSNSSLYEILCHTGYRVNRIYN